MRQSLTILLLFINLRLFAQLSVGTEGITILPGTSLTIDGLSLTPSANLTIANNRIQKVSTPIAGNPSINRLYQFDTALPFSGTVGIGYLASELNGFTESTLQLAYASTANTSLTVTSGSTVNASTHYVSNSLTNKNLFIVTAAALSDLSPILFTNPSNVHGTHAFSIVVDVVELNSVATNGSFIVKVTRDDLINLTFDSALTTLNGRTVKNSAWSFDDSDPDVYILSTSESIAAGQRLSFGLSGTLSPGSSSGSLTVTSVIQPTTLVEKKLTNNIDADRVDYFQQ